MKEQRRFLAPFFATFLFLVLPGCETETSQQDAPEGLAAGISHRVSGTAAQIDRSSGMMTVETEPAALRLPFDAGAIADLREGDAVTVRLTLSKPAAPEPAGRAFDAPEREPLGGPPSAGEGHSGQRSVTGTVRNIDHGNGMFDLQVGTEMLTVYFPADQIEDLENGNRVVLSTALSSEDGEG